MKNMTMVTAVIAALVFLAGISVAAGESTIQPRVLGHDEIVFWSPMPMSHPVPFPKEMHWEIDTTPALAYLIYPSISNITSEDIGFEVTLTDEVHSLSDIGKPKVPYITKQFEIPGDYKVESVSVSLSDPIEISNISIEPAQPPVVGSAVGDYLQNYTPPAHTIDNETYIAHEPYPGNEYKYRLGGNPIHGKRVVVHIFPIQYIPSENKIIAYRNASISVSVTPSPIQPSALAPRLLGAGDEYECVIITHPDFVDECERLADWKTKTGISTNVVYTTWINNNFAGFDGTDLQAKIKQFIYESYLDDTEYIILAGDVDRVPTRYAYVNDTNQNDGKYVPCDLYYVDVVFHNGTLSDWDPSSDGLYGAMGPDVDTDTPDMEPDVCIGRLPASTEDELNTLIDKIIKYEIDAYNSDWVKKATLIADDACFNNSEYLKDRTEQHFEDWGVPSANIQKLYGASCSVDNRLVAK